MVPNHIFFLSFSFLFSRYSMSTSMSIPMSISMSIPMSTSMSIPMSISMSTSKLMFIPMSPSIPHIHIHIHVHVHIHTHIHVHLPSDLMSISHLIPRPPHVHPLPSPPLHPPQYCGYT